MSVRTRCIALASRCFAVLWKIVPNDGRSDFRPVRGRSPSNTAQMSLLRRCIGLNQGIGKAFRMFAKAKAPSARGSARRTDASLHSLKRPKRES